MITPLFSSEKKSFSVVICTYNRSQYLPELVTSLLAQTYPRNLYEIIIVDNASTDDTQQVVNHLIENRFVPLRNVFEAKLGLSHARNTGAQAARGEILAYIDDDAVADPGWLAGLSEAFNADDQVVCVGGRIELLWDNPRPAWMPSELEGYLGCNNFLGNKNCELPANQHPFGGNLAIKQKPFELIMGFDPNFGRIGTYLGAHEETRIVNQLRSLGKIIYAPDALVYHHVPDWRATKKYLLKRGYLDGVASTNLYQVNHPRTRARLLRVVAADLFFLLGDLWKIVKYFFLHRQKETFASLVFAVTRLGQIRRTLQLVFGK